MLLYKVTNLRWKNTITRPWQILHGYKWSWLTVADLSIAPLESKCPRAFYLFGGQLSTSAPVHPCYYLSICTPVVDNCGHTKQMFTYVLYLLKQPFEYPKYYLKFFKTASISRNCMVANMLWHVNFWFHSKGSSLHSTVNDTSSIKLRSRCNTIYLMLRCNTIFLC